MGEIYNDKLFIFHLQYGTKTKPCTNPYERKGKLAAALFGSALTAREIASAGEM